MDQTSESRSLVDRRQLVASLGAIGLAGRALAASSIAARTPFVVRSPNGKLALTLDLSHGRPTWAVAEGGSRMVLQPSGLGLRLADGRLLGANVALLGSARSAHVGRWTPRFGISRTYDETWNALTLHLRDIASGIEFDIIARMLDGAAAIRYAITNPNGAASLSIAGEETEYRFDPNATYYAGRDEGEIHAAKLFDFAPRAWPPLTLSTDKGPLADYPITIDIGNGLYALMAESDRPHYPRGMVRQTDTGLRTYLMRYPGRTLGPLSAEIPTPEEPDFDLAVGQETPWRVIIVAGTPYGLIDQAGIVPTLATPSILGDVDWIKPGRAFRVMFPYTTDTGMAAVDFAAARRLQYVTFDWRWYGDGTDYSDATVPIAALDLKKVIAYGKSKGVEIILYVDRYAAVRDFATLARLYRSWGVAGVKLGFIWEGRKSDADTLFTMIKTCADHRLLADVHDNIRPSGLDRTLPNYVAMEGTRGNEQFPPARHNVNLAFQRAVAGPMDYTICYEQDRSQTTNAHQLALAAIYYDPQTYLYWYDKPEKYDGRAMPELDWFDAVPTTWDETRALSGALGEFVVVARRNGETWYLGAITNEQSREIDVDLSFLDAGIWTAHIFRDGAWNRWIYKSEVVIERRTVQADATLTIAMNPAGGQAIRFERNS